MKKKHLIPLFLFTSRPPTVKNNMTSSLVMREGVRGVPKNRMVIGAIISFFICITLPLIAQPNDPIRLNRAQERFHQALYHIQSQAQQTGWTDDLNQLAGDIYFQMNDISSAVVYWERANLIDSARLELLAQSYLELQQWENATTILLRLFDFDPANEWASWHYSVLMIMNMDADMIEQVQARFQSLLESPIFAPSATSILEVATSDVGQSEKSLQLGLILASIDRWDLAELAFQLALVNDVILNDGVGAREMGYIAFARYMQGKPVLDWFMRALQADPHNDQANYLYGMYLRGVGELDDSLDTLVIAISQNPNNPAYYIELGLTYYAKNDTQQGDYWLQFARDMADDSEIINTIIDDFYAQRQSDVFDFDALQALLEATPEITPEVTLVP
jgi:tetratricopeptide (TPR) repeat protein